MYRFTAARFIGLQCSEDKRIHWAAMAKGGAIANGGFYSRWPKQPEPYSHFGLRDQFWVYQARVK